MDWLELAAAYAAFFLSHSLPVRPPMRPWLVARLGPTGITIAYSALSLIVLAWLISAIGRAPWVLLWQWAPWQNLITLFAMLPVCLILALAIGRPNPFSFGGAHDDRFDPEHAGIVRLTRHPLLTALAIWSTAHVLPNGDLAHVMLFGTFAAFALFGARMVDRRKMRDLGAVWQELHDTMSASPVLTGFSMPQTAARVVFGLFLYGSILFLHPALFGVNPLI